MTRRVAALVAAVLVAGLSGCAASSRAQSSGTTTLTVLAAASLSDAFRDAARQFEADHPQIKVALSFAGSQTLVAQVRQGIRADVLATADGRTMAAARGDTTGTPVVFARNRLVIAVPRGNPQHIASLQDLARPGLVVVLADPAVPAGRYAASALAAAHVTVHPRSLENDVRAVLTKVRLGEADAGIVYASDVAATHGASTSVAIPGAPVAAYPVATLRGGHLTEATAFVEFLRSADGQAVLRRHGFIAP